MEQVVPWSALQAQIEPHYPQAGRGRHPYRLETMLRIHLMQQWYALSDPAMEEALYEDVCRRRLHRRGQARSAEGQGDAWEEGPVKQAWRRLETLRAQVRARLEHSFRVIKQQFGHSKMRYRGLAKNTSQLQVMFALANLWLARKRLLAMTGEVRL